MSDSHDLIAIKFQRATLWACIACALLLIAAWGFLVGMLPLPPATWTSAEIAAFYTENQTRIRWGAAILGWTSGFWLPFTVIVGVQIARIEKGTPILAIMQTVAGAIQSIFLAIPMMFWGIAAFTPDRLPDVTAALHQTANLLLMSTDQYYLWQTIPWIIVCFVYKSPVFPRWYGYFMIWFTVMAEAGVMGLITKTGVFAWNGLFVFYFPFGLLSVSIIILMPRLFKALREQEAELKLEATATTG